MEGDPAAGPGRRTQPPDPAAGPGLDVPHVLRQPTADGTPGNRTPLRSLQPAAYHSAE